MNLHRIVLRQADKNQPMTLGNIELLMDGTPLQGVQKITIEADCSNQPPKVFLEMIADVKVEGEMHVAEKTTKYV